MMGKIIDKMIGDTDKDAFEEMMPILTIKIMSNGKEGTDTDKEEEEEGSDLLKKLKDRSPQYVEEKE